MEWLSAAQMWVIVAAFALIAELFTVSFFFFFLSVGAAITALLTWLGITPDSTSQLLCFVVVSLVSLALFRKYALRIFGKNERVDSYQSFVGDRAVVSVSIPANGEGKIHYRGTEWIALSHKGIPLAEGTSVVVKKMDGIRVIVEAADI
ncbi:MAG: NfeD family protein [Saprospiraceae bacterium]|nr:NfeD family protein [Saprospiraceae bacterium]